MNQPGLNMAFLFLASWLLVFGQTQFAGIRAWMGAPVAVIPALVAYSAMTHGILATTTLAVVSGLWIDSLSSSRLGVSVAPLFLVGFLLHSRRHLILRDLRYAQFWIGFGSGACSNLLVLLLLSAGQRQPLVGWATLWQIPFLAFLNGLACPGAFIAFDWLEEVFGYRPVTQSSFRPDRETVRGRHDRIH